MHEDPPEEPQADSIFSQDSFDLDLEEYVQGT